MKYIFLLILVIAVSSIKAQSIEMHLEGELVGNKKVKYALLYVLNGGFQISKKAVIYNNKFYIKDLYDPAKSKSIWQACYLVLSDEEHPSEEYINKNNIRLFYEKDVELIYFSDLSEFSITKGVENLVENKFYRNNVRYLRKRDSLSRIIEKEPINAELKFAKKQKGQTTFLKEMYASNLILIKSNPNSLASMLNFIPYPAIGLIPYEEAESVYQLYSDSTKNTKHGKQIANLILRQKKDAARDPKATKLNINDTMYDFSLDDIKGENMKSRDLYGTYTLIDFWASWCIPCRNETPYVKKAFEQFKEKGFKVVAISIDAEDAKEKWKAAVEVDGINGFVNLFNPSGKPGIAKELNINAIPANYMVDKNGRIIAKNLRGSDLIELLSKLYKQN